MLKKISLLVCTNRPHQPYSRIWQQVVNQPSLQQIILATQESVNNFDNKEQKVIHLPLATKGRSKAINSGLKEISSFAIALTDDDCIMQKNWIDEAIKTLNDPEIALVYGQTKAYRPELHKNKFCPSTFKKKPNVFSITSKLGKHWLDVGFDNNAAIKNEVFQNIGSYKWWLGPGCLVPYGEDAEFILRALISGYKIAYNPKMVVHHDRFLSASDYLDLEEAYSYGGLVAYGFYVFQGVIELKSVFIDNIKYFYYGAKNDFKNKNFRRCYRKISFLVRGLIIAFVFAKLIPIPKKENVVRRFYKNRINK